MGFSLLSIIYLQQIYRLGVWEKSGGGLTSHVEVLLSPMCWYLNTDVWTFLKPMLLIEHMKMMQMLSWHKVSGSFWASAFRTNSNQLFWKGLFQKKTNRGFEDILFWKKPWDFFCFSLYPWKFQAKQSSAPGNLVKLCMLQPLEISSPQNQDPWKFQMNFSWSTLEIPLCF